MKKSIFAAAAVLAVFATPALAEGDCTAMLAKLDAGIEASKAADDVKMKLLEMREQGAKQQAAGDEKSCQATVAGALNMLAK
jgi:hypothetical protein